MKFVEDIIRRMIAERMACCCNNSFGITTLSPPVDEPGTNGPFVLKNLTTGEEWYWNGSSWQSGSGSTNSRIEQIGILIDGGGSAITDGIKGRFRVPFSGTITGWTILEVSDVPVAGDIVIDIKSGTYDDYDATPVFTSITGSEKPTISGDVKGQDLSLSTWTTAVTAGTIIEYAVEAGVATVEKVQLFIDILKD